MPLRGRVRASVANLEYAAAAGYIRPMSDDMRRRFDHIIGVLVRILYQRR